MTGTWKPSALKLREPKVKSNNLRQQRKENTRKKLIEVASGLFKEKGFDNTTIDEIVGLAEVSQRTFFRHFQSKEAIVFSKVRGRQARFRLYLDRNAETVDPFERIKFALLKTADEYDSDPEALLEEYQIVSASPYLTTRDVEHDSNIERMMTAALMRFQGKRFLSRKQARIAGAAIFGAVRVLMDEWFQKECTHALRNHARYCVQIIDMLALGYGGSGNEARKKAKEIKAQ